MITGLEAERLGKLALLFEVRADDLKRIAMTSKGFDPFRAMNMKVHCAHRAELEWGVAQALRELLAMEQGADDGQWVSVLSTLRSRTGLLCRDGTSIVRELRSLAANIETRMSNPVLTPEAGAQGAGAP